MIMPHIWDSETLIKHIRNISHIPLRFDLRFLIEICSSDSIILSDAFLDSKHDLDLINWI